MSFQNNQDYLNATFTTPLHDVGRVHCHQCRAQSDVTVQGLLLLKDTLVEGNVTVMGHCILQEKSLILGSLNVQGHLEVQEGEVRGNLSLTGQATLSNLKVSGNFQLQATELTLTNCHLNTIEMSLAQAGDNMTSIAPDGQMIVAVSAGSRSHVNGYEIQASGNETTVTVPSGTVYINGKKQSGDGPASFSAYRAEQFDVPHISGPGWNETPLSASQKEAPAMRITLEAGSQVQGNIRFLGGQGVISVLPGARFDGTVTNGQVQTS